MAQQVKHNGVVRSMDFNPYQNKLLASGASESEIYIWDLNNTVASMTPGTKAQPFEDVQGHSRECTRKNGVTNIKLTGDKVVAARLSSRIDFLRLEIYTKSRQIDWGFSFAYRRTHIRTGSAGSLSIFQQPNGPARVHHASEEELRGIQEVHQSPRVVARSSR
ncbi:protein transport protein Sec31B [Culex quinquefasciatus]|uniref:protein transport protein Sec31B n=1 Tax=Culex quinquefasciatus TaxID=7176 RepID=UPI0018E3C2B0|nr:protein transport protein Sec31B [Culex quinquefasciatus]